MDPGRLRIYLGKKSQPAYRAGQALEAFCLEGASSYREVTVLPQSLRSEFERAVPSQSLREETVRLSGDGKAHKAHLRLHDGLSIETVLLSPKPGLWSVCVSSQVGCALRCAFCATGFMGFQRNLTTEEMADQVLYWRQYLKARKLPHKLTNVVFMGMGEPFENAEAVFESIRWLTDPALYGFSQRHIAVSTAGIAPGIEAFSREFRQASLALSLHAATDELREKLVPLNKAYPLARLAESLRRYFDYSKQKVFIEYVLLKGTNDGLQHARGLAHYLKGIGRPDLLHVNLVAYNPTRSPFVPPDLQTILLFKGQLLKEGVRATIRKSLGREIEGACGQLITQERQQKKATES